MGSDSWRVGELARATGVTVRTLHYYEEIGLLVPSGRTAAGHRVYGADDLARLQQIVSLRDLGFSLDEIAAMLARPDSSPLATIRLHLDRLRADIRDKQQLFARLERLAAQLEQTGRASAQDLLETVRWTMNYDKYYTQEQLDYLAKRRELFTDEEMAAVQDEWQRIFADLRAAMEAGTDPKDPSVQAIMKRSDELIAMFTGGDEGVRKSLGNLWANEQAPKQMMGIDDALADYLRRAREN